MSAEEPKVWGVFVGDAGDQLEAFNSKAGPFPPDPGSVGYIAIGWPAVGDMRLYKDNYPDFVEKFRIAYPNDNERVLKTTANMPWNFAFKMQSGDWIMCPSSTSGYLLAGKVEGEYLSNFHGSKSLPNANTRVDFVHLRKVKWMYVVSDKDPRYAKLHRIGQLTVVQPDISASTLQGILNGGL